MSGGTRSCVACGSGLTLKRTVRSQFLDRDQYYDICACGACGHWQAFGDMSAAVIAEVYSGRFHSSSQQITAKSGVSRPAGHTPAEVNAAERALWLHSQDMKGRLLDVGAGRGAFVAAAKQYFSASGIELSKDAARSASEAGLDVAVADFMAASPACPAQFDVVTMWDVLACFEDVRGALARAASSLKLGGRLVVTVPDAASIPARVLGPFWPLLIPPVNIHYFTRASIVRLMAAAGLEVEAAEHRAKSVAVRFMAEKAMRSLGVPAAVRFSGVVPGTWSMRLNTGDILTVIARRRDA